MLHVVVVFVQVCAAAGVAPGYHTQKYADKCQTKRIKKQETMSLPSTKLRRIVLKQERAVHQGAQETLEGDCYQSGKSMLFTWTIL